MPFIKNLNLEILIIFFSSLYILGDLTEGLSVPKNIGLYISIFLWLYYAFKEKLNFSLFQNEKILSIIGIGFFISILLSIIFSFSSHLPSLKEFLDEFLNITIIFFIITTLKKSYLKYWFYLLIFAFFWNILRYGILYYQENPSFNLSIRFFRSSSNYFEILYPFLLMFILLEKRIIKFIGIIGLILGLFELILTGARGSWGAIFIETILFLIGIVFMNKKYLKKSLLSILSIFILGTGSGIYLYKHSSLIKNKIHQGLNPNGRNKIVETRLPIFLKHQNYLTGIGGPENYQYNKFLNYYKAPEIYGNKEGNKFHYWSDEPFLLQLFYKEGILGLSLFILFFIVLSLKIFQFIKNNSEFNTFFMLSIFISYTGSFFIRGLFEGRYLKYIVFYFLFYLLVKKDKDENSLYLS